MRQFISGMLVMAFAVAGLFFLRFAKRTKDSFFTWLAIAFWIFGAVRMGLTLTSESLEGTVFYIFRLIGFLIIIAAIWRKNAQSKGKDDGA